jgi:hypothetical protein
MKGSFKRISYEDLLPDPFQRIRRVSCFSGLLFSISTGVSSGLNGSRTAERRTPQDAEGRRRRLRSDRSRISYRTYRNRASILLVPGISSLKAAAVFRQGDNVSSFVLLSLSLVSRVLSCVCVCNLEFKLFFDNIICKSDAGNLRVAF